MDFFVQAVNVLKILVMAVGAGLGAWGVINLMEGYGNDNPGAKSNRLKTNPITFKCIEVRRVAYVWYFR